MRRLSYWFAVAVALLVLPALARAGDREVGERITGNIWASDGFRGDGVPAEYQGGTTWLYDRVVKRRQVNAIPPVDVHAKVPNQQAKPLSSKLAKPAPSAEALRRPSVATTPGSRPMIAQAVCYWAATDPGPRVDGQMARTLADAAEPMVLSDAADCLAAEVFVSDHVEERLPQPAANAARATAVTTGEGSTPAARLQTSERTANGVSAPSATTGESSTLASRLQMSQRMTNGEGAPPATMEESSTLASRLEMPERSPRAWLIQSLPEPSRHNWAQRLGRHDLPAMRALVEE